MGYDNAEMIRILEAELDVIEGGGYGRPAGEPNTERPMFYHSQACINHWLIPGRQDACDDDCVLMDFVPAGAKKEALPCHLIVLNEAGDTVKSLEEGGDQERLEREVKNWLRTTIARLKAQEGSGSAASSDAP